MPVRQLSLADIAGAYQQLGESWRRIKEQEQAAKAERQGAGATLGGLAGGIAGSFLGPVGTAGGAAGGAFLGGQLASGDRTSVGGGGNTTSAAQYAQGFSLGNQVGGSISAANKEAATSKGLAALAAARASERNPVAKPSAPVTAPNPAFFSDAPEEAGIPQTISRTAFTPDEMAQNAKRKGILDTIGALGKSGAFTAATAPGLTELIAPSYKPVDVSGGSAYGTFDPSTGKYNMTGVVPKQFKNTEEQYGTGTMGMMARIAAIDAAAQRGEPISTEDRLFVSQAKQYLSMTAAGVDSGGNPVMAPRVQYGKGSPYQTAVTPPASEDGAFIPGGKTVAEKFAPVSPQAAQVGTAALTGSQALGKIMENSAQFGNVPYGNLGNVISGKLGQNVPMIEVENSILSLAAAAEAAMPGPETEKDSQRIRQLIGDPTSPWKKIEVAVTTQAQKINNSLLGTMRNSLASNTRIDENSREALFNSSQFVPVKLRGKDDPLLKILIPGTRISFEKR